MMPCLALIPTDIDNDITTLQLWDESAGGSIGDIRLTNPDIIRIRIQ